MTKGTMQIEYEKLVMENIEFKEKIKELILENAKLNIILYHRENGLSHPDFKPEIEISKQAEKIKELEEELDAECRISQMLLANKKKQAKRIEELEAELTRLRKIINAKLPNPLLS